MLNKQLVYFIYFSQPTRRQWQKVLYITAAIYLIGTLGFVILGKGEEQPWNTPNDENPLLVEAEQEQDRSGLASVEGCDGSTSINTV